MRVILVTRETPAQRYLVHLLTRDLVLEVRKLINNRKHARAARLVFERGSVVRTISQRDLMVLKADLILSEESACWDLVE